jgi:S-adenosylmethionine-diacylglycerol 3-amino-3-carboxypropyl transferase
MGGFFHNVNYSSCNEDGRSELAALRLSVRDRVVCVTGSGARPLDLLLDGPGRVVSVDINPAQNHLLELKLAALKTLSYLEYAQVLGLREFGGRRLLYDRLRQNLSERARAFWDHRPGLIERGVIYQGTWERYFRRLAGLVGIFRGHRLRLLMTAGSIDEQASIWSNLWDDAAWRAFVRIVSARAAWRWWLRDPGFHQFVPKTFCVGSYLLDCLTRSTRQFELSESAFASLLLTGRYSPGGPLPLHLDPRHFDVLKSRADRIDIVTAPLARLLNSEPHGSIDAFSISDLSSYTAPDQYEESWRAILRSASSGARICERQFLVKRDLPPSIARHVTRDAGLEAQLLRSDTSIFYTFVIACVD